MATTIGPEDPAFVGFVPVSLRPFPTGSYFTCPTSAFYTASASYQGCCYPDTKCVIATACEDNTLQFGGSSVTCTGTASCNQRVVVPTSGPTQTAYYCGEDIPYGRTLYRADPASATDGSAPESTETSAGASVPSGQSSSTSTSSSSSAGAKPSGSASKSAPASDATYGEAPGTPPAKSPSKAWIAGAVIGPLAFVALAGLGIMLFRRRRRAAAAAAAAQTNLASSPGDQKDAGFYYKPPAAYDQRASSAAWGPDSGFYKPVPAPPAETAYEGAHELAGDRSTQVFIELPAYGQGQGESPVELPAHSHDQHGK